VPSEPPEVEHKAPVITSASLTRLPPIETAAEVMPTPPLPPVTTQVSPVVTPGLLTPPQRLETAQPSTDRKRASLTLPAARRQIPGAQFGTGMVTSLRFKEGLALIEFANDGAVPPGSVVRAYHEYALTGKKSVCDLEVIRGESGLAAAVARPGSALSALSIGDRAIVLQ
jgi:hypothetical protein